MIFWFRLQYTSGAVVDECKVMGKFGTAESLLKLQRITSMFTYTIQRLLSVPVQCYDHTKNVGILHTQAQRLCHENAKTLISKFTE